MSNHSGTVFTNSCLNTPINPINKLPSPSYERKLYNKYPVYSETYKTCLENSCEKSVKRSDPIMSFTDFYRSIPDYNELTHLSNSEFYRKLNELKYKRRELEYAPITAPVDNDVCDMHNVHVKCCTSKPRSPRKYYKNTYSTYKKCRDTDFNYNSYESDSTASFSKTNISSPKRTKNVDSNSRLERLDNNLTFNLEDNVSPKKDECDFDNAEDFSNIVSDYFINDEDDKFVRKSRSVPCSPVRKKVTIPKPFEMTKRDEDDRVLSNLCKSSEGIFREKSNDVKDNNVIKANPIPIESRIPMYDRIMAEQERRRKINKINSAIELNAQMKPFHFNERPRMSSRCLSTPHLYGSTFESSPSKTFKAGPVPKNTYSNYFYKKMLEDDSYRSLKRRIRAEEMLRASSLPPTMAKREKQSKGKCSRGCYLDIDYLTREFREFSPSLSCSSGNTKVKRKRRKNRRSTTSANNDKTKQTGTNSRTEFISTTPETFCLETSKRCNNRKPVSPYLSRSPTKFKPAKPSTSPPLYPLSRINLAAALRAQAARMKLQQQQPANETPMQAPHRGWSAGTLRNSPAWHAIHYPTHSADLAERLQTRREEQRLRQAQHNLNMELMIDRVLKTPLLLERDWGQYKPNRKPHCQYSNDKDYEKCKTKHNRIRTEKIAKDGRHRLTSEDKYSQKDDFDSYSLDYECDDRSDN